MVGHPCSPSELQGLAVAINMHMTLSLQEIAGSNFTSMTYHHLKIHKDPQQYTGARDSVTKRVSDGTETEHGLSATIM